VEAYWKKFLERKKLGLKHFLLQPKHPTFGGTGVGRKGEEGKGKKGGGDGVYIDQIKKKVGWGLENKETLWGPERGGNHPSRLIIKGSC